MSNGDYPSQNCTQNEISQEGPSVGKGSICEVGKYC